MPNIKDTNAATQQEIKNVALGTPPTLESIHLDHLFLEPLSAEPTTPEAYMIVNADGTTWDPGFGAGYYVRNATNTAWELFANASDGGGTGDETDPPDTSGMNFTMTPNADNPLGSIDINFNGAIDASGINHYELHNHPGNTPVSGTYSQGSATNLVQGSTTTVSTLIPGTYVWKVLAVDDSINFNEAYSNEASYTITVDGVYLARPTSLGLTEGADKKSIDLLWTRVTNNTNADCTNYYIERSWNYGQDWIQVATVSSATFSYTDADIAPGYDYMYRVCSTDTIQKSDYTQSSQIIRLGLLVESTFDTDGNLHGQTPEIGSGTYTCDPVDGMVVSNNQAVNVTALSDFQFDYPQVNKKMVWKLSKPIPLANSDVNFENRYVDSNNQYVFQARYKADGTVKCICQKWRLGVKYQSAIISYDNLDLSQPQLWFLYDDGTEQIFYNGADTSVYLSSAEVDALDTQGNDFLTEQTVRVKTSADAGDDKFELVSCTKWAEAGVDYTAPDGPATLTATPYNTYIDLSWAASSAGDLLEYAIYLDNKEIKTIPAGTTTARIPNLERNTAYDIKILARDTSFNQSGQTAATGNPITTLNQTVSEVIWTGNFSGGTIGSAIDISNTGGSATIVSTPARHAGNTNTLACVTDGLGTTKPATRAEIVATIDNKPLKFRWGDVGFWVGMSFRFSTSVPLAHSYMRIVSPMEPSPELVNCPNGATCSAGNVKIDYAGSSVALGMSSFDAVVRYINSADGQVPIIPRTTYCRGLGMLSALSSASLGTPTTADVWHDLVFNFKLNQLGTMNIWHAVSTDPGNYTKIVDNASVNNILFKDSCGIDIRKIRKIKTWAITGNFAPGDLLARDGSTSIARYYYANGVSEYGTHYVWLTGATEFELSDTITNLSRTGEMTVSFEPIPIDKQYQIGLYLGLLTGENDIARTLYISEVRVAEGNDSGGFALVRPDTDRY